MAKGKMFPGKFILIIFAASLVSAVGYTVWSSYLKPHAVPVSINQVVTGGAVSLSMAPSKQLTLPNTEITMTVNVSSGTNKLTAVQLEINYDPAKLQVSGFTPTSYLPTVLVNPSVANGKITTVLGADANSGGIAGSGTIATFKVKPLVPGTHSVSFGANTLAAVVESETNALGSVADPTFKAAYPGDMNGDKVVDALDYNKFLPAFGTSGEPGFSLADFKMDGTINALDYNVFVGKFGTHY